MISRLILVLGIVLIVLGLVGMVAGVTGIGGNFVSLISDAVNPTAAELCRAGETLAQEEGAEEYSPTNGYRRSVRYFCVNEAGVRREVTGDFVQGMLGQAFASIPALFVPMIGGCALTLGIILAVAGAIFSARRRAVARVSTSGYAFDFPEGATQQSQIILKIKLRQLEQARKSGLISEREYLRKRQELLDSDGEVEGL